MPASIFTYRAWAKPYEFIGFGALDVTKPYEFIGFGALDVTKPYKFIGFGTSGGSNCRRHPAQDCPPAARRASLCKSSCRSGAVHRA